MDQARLHSDEPKTLKCECLKHLKGLSPFFLQFLMETMQTRLIQTSFDGRHAYIVSWARMEQLIAKISEGMTLEVTEANSKGGSKEDFYENECIF